MPTVFEQIIAGELPSKKVFENERIIAFHDIAPKAPVHVLIVTKKAIPSIHDVEPEDLPVIGEMVQVAQQLAKDLGVDDGYRLVTNRGPKAGQTVFHLHIHLLGGRDLGIMG